MLKRARKIHGSDGSQEDTDHTHEWALLILHQLLFKWEVARNPKIKKLKKNILGRG